MKGLSGTAARFVVGIGVVSLFADFTYEGGRSIVGPYLATRGAGPLLVGLIAGGGEYLDYGVRLFSGGYVDRHGRHWPLMALGYTANLLAVPALLSLYRAHAHSPPRPAHAAATRMALPGAYWLYLALVMVTALVVGRYFDRFGLNVLYSLPLLTLPATPLLFLTTWPAAIWLGVALWGAALGVQESSMRAGVAHLTDETQRGTAYGLFDTAFGAAWMLGSLIMGALYGVRPVYLVVFAVLLQVAAIPLLLRMPKARLT